MPQLELLAYGSAHAKTMFIPQDIMTDKFKCVSVMANFYLSHSWIKSKICQKLPVIVTDKPKISASRSQVLSDIDCDRQGFA